MAFVKYTADDLRIIRKATGLTIREFAEVIGVTDERSLRRYESGEREMSGTLQKLLNYIDPGLIGVPVGNPLPRFFICVGPDGHEYIQRNRYPRFIAHINARSRKEPPVTLGAIHWIDEPLNHDQDKLLADAIDYYTSNHF